MKILVVDVGGSNLKIGLSGRKGPPLKVPSGARMSAAGMVAAVKKVTRDWRYDAVTVGFPGPVVSGRPTREPVNLGRGWKGFDFKKAFGKPVRVMNDAAMQALGSYQGGRMLFLGLGTGMGSALLIDGVLVPTELAHLPYRNGRSYEDYVGGRGLKRLGRARWTKHVHKVVALLQHGLQCDYVVLGGGHTKKLKSSPEGVRIGDNLKAILGGIRLWEREAVPVRARRRRATSRSRPGRRAVNLAHPSEADARTPVSEAGPAAAALETLEMPSSS
jgi:predicted NBD/HSP70 family sugar kinase